MVAAMVMPPETSSFTTSMTSLAVKESNPAMGRQEVRVDGLTKKVLQLFMSKNAILSMCADTMPHQVSQE